MTEKSQYDEFVLKRLSASEVPHYKFVQFLTVLCAGMLGLSAPQESISIDGDVFHALLRQYSLVLLAVSVALGVVALYGETAVHQSHAAWLQSLPRKHKDSYSLAAEEAKSRKGIRPPAIHRYSFVALCTVAPIAVGLLVASKATLLFP